MDKEIGMTDRDSSRRSDEHAPTWYARLTHFQDRTWGRATFQLINTLVPYVAIFGIMLYGRWNDWPYWSTLIISVPASLFLVRIFILFHDCTHESFVPSRRGNRIIGFFTGALVFTAYESWRLSHLRHHATNGKLDHRGIGDVYTMTLEEYRSAPARERLRYRVYRSPISLFLVGPLYTFLVVYRFKGLRKSKAERNSTLLANAFVVTVGLSLSLVFGFGSYIGVQIPILFFAGAMGFWLFYVQHQFDPGYWAHDETWDKFDAALNGSSHYKLPAILGWFTANIGIHHLHHLQPRIPNYRLRRAYLANPDVQDNAPLTLFKSLASLRIHLYSEIHKQFMSFGKAKKLIRE